MSERRLTTIDWHELSRLMHVTQGLYHWVDDNSIRQQLLRLRQHQVEQANLAGGAHDGTTHRAHRVATLVYRLVYLGAQVEPLTLDLVHDAHAGLTSRLRDGHHRLRALQYIDLHPELNIWGCPAPMLRRLPVLVYDPLEVLAQWPS